MLTQVPGVQTRVEVEGIAESGQRGVRIRRRKSEFPGSGHKSRQRVLFDAVVQTFLTRPDPSMMERQAVIGIAVTSEGVKINVAGPGPVLEFDPQLVGRLRLSHELIVVQSGELIEPVNGRDRRLSDSDRSYFVGLDQKGLDLRPDRLGQCGRCHPACSSSTQDADPSYSVFVHPFIPFDSGETAPTRIAGRRAGPRS